jgi:hypothetical protein
VTWPLFSSVAGNDSEVITGYDNISNDHNDDDDDDDDDNNNNNNYNNNNGDNKAQ